MLCFSVRLEIQSKAPVKSSGQSGPGQCWHVWSLLYRESQPFGGFDSLKSGEKGALYMESEG